MQITAPVTDYIPASLLTALGDIVIRGAANPERLASVDWRGVHIALGTRSTAGVQVITGVGFRPSIIILISTSQSDIKKNFSIGFDNGTVHMCMYRHDNDTLQNIKSDVSMYVREDISNILSGTVTDLSADGFSITFVLVGAVLSEYIYLCLP